MPQNTQFEMASHPDLTSADGLSEYLKADRQSKEISVTLLSGGTANFVYRVSDIHNSTSIFKHAAPYLANNRNFAFDQRRMDYEARALEILSPANGESPFSKLLPRSAVHAVRLISYDKERKLLCIEDGGNRNLKEFYDDPELDISGVGQELAQWVAALHMCPEEISLGLSDHGGSIRGSNNNLIAVNIYRHSYNNLHTTLAQYGHDTVLADRINERFGTLLATDDECICHGDYWPGNVLVLLPIRQGEAAELTIIDWEVSAQWTKCTKILG